MNPIFKNLSTIIPNVQRTFINTNTPVYRLATLNLLQISRYKSGSLNPHRIGNGAQTFSGGISLKKQALFLLGTVFSCLYSTANADSKEDSLNPTSNEEKIEKKENKISDQELHFPNAEIMKNFLSNHELLKFDYYQEKGITEVVVKLAAERFAGKDLVELGITMGTMLLINDLQCGIDGFSGEPIPNFRKINMPDIFWVQLSMSIEAALIDCAKNAK